MVTAGDFRTSYREDLKLVRTNWVRGWIVVLLLSLSSLPKLLIDRSLFGVDIPSGLFLGMSLSRVNFALIAIIGAVGLQLLTGYAGLISLGNAALFAVGAVGAAVTANQLHLPFPVAVLAASCFGAGVGAVVGLPSLRVRGLYLLLTTMALQFISAYCFLRYQQQFYGAATGGIGFPDAYLGPFKLADDRAWYFVLLPITMFTLICAKNLLRMRMGRALVAIRDHDVAAASVGINVGATKLKGFAMSSFVVSMAGAFFAFYLSNVSPDTFSLELAIQYVAMIIIGGMGTLLGSVLGALVWQLLPQVIYEFTRAVDPHAPVIGPLVSQQRAQVVDLLLGVIIIVMLIVKPDGLAGMWAGVRRYFQSWPFAT